MRGEGTDLDVEKLVLRLGVDHDVVSATFKRGYKKIGVFLVGDSGDLDDRSTSNNSRRLAAGRYGRRCGGDRMW